MRLREAILILVSLIYFAVPGYSCITENVGVEIRSDDGGAYTAISFKDVKTGGTHIIKKYLEAKKGEDYSIVIRNNTHERIGVVIAVDGRNIISGKSSDLKNNEDMYIVEPYGYTELDGWRTDRDTVHKFYFTDVSDSYSVRTFGDSSAMGLIAVAVFREKDRPIVNERQMRKGKVPMPGARSYPFAESESKKNESGAAGTGFGHEQYSPTIKVKFEPESDPFQKILVKYEWRETLCSNGILKCRTEERNRLWDGDEYAPYPPGYGDWKNGIRSY
ncbi:MAG: hypothetical protein HY758_07370 [Nitrospirae bacterium]|nr:hypothetical protein [Nitrospirota bacterium]